VISLAERRRLLLRRSELATIAKLPNWEVLNAAVEEDIDEIKRVVMAQVMGAGASLEEQAFQRGRIIGMRSVLSIPQRALNEETDQKEAAGE